MKRSIAIVGGGPAGLMAAEVIGGAGHAVQVYDAMPSVGRKFLMAGKSGLNLTHAEAHEKLRSRFSPAPSALTAALDAFDGSAVRAWAEGLGVATFVGSSGRVFPTAMKASPLLRAWLGRLAGLGVTVRTRHRWVGFEGEALVFETPERRVTRTFDAVVLALGGSSWPRLGSDAAWVPSLEAKGVAVNRFKPSNCGFDVDWSPFFSERFAGQPVKSVMATSAAGTIAGEFVIGAKGVEGGLIYAHAAALREENEPVLVLDLAPERDEGRIAADLARQPAKSSFSNRLRKAVGLDPVKIGMVRELTSAAVRSDTAALACAIKSLALPLVGPRPIAEAISTAGGVVWEGIDDRYMLKALPGVFVAGEMLDWEAPTGGYLLSACFATGRAAGQGVLAYLKV